MILCIILYYLFGIINAFMLSFMLSYLICNNGCRLGQIILFVIFYYIIINHIVLLLNAYIYIGYLLLY